MSYFFPNEFEGLQHSAGSAGADRGARFGIGRDAGRSGATGEMSLHLIMMKERMKQQRMAEYQQALQAMAQLGMQGFMANRMSGMGGEPTFMQKLQMLMRQRGRQPYGDGPMGQSEYGE